MNKELIYFKTIYKLGFLNVLSVLYYRIFTHSLLTKLYFPQKVYKELKSVFLPSTNRKSISENQRIRIIECADSILEGNVYYYSHRKQYVGGKPVWFLNSVYPCDRSKKSQRERKRLYIRFCRYIWSCKPPVA